MERGDEQTLDDWRSNVAWLLGLVTGIVAIDQIVKAIVTGTLVPGQSVTVIPGLLHFTLVRNTGMAFGILSGTDLPYKSIIMTLLAVAAMGAVTYYALRTAQSERMTRAGLTLILGGALGNIVDRIRFGSVVDFVDVFYGDAHWPAFNVADACICIGVGLLILDSFRHRKPALTEAETPATAGRGDL